MPKLTTKSKALAYAQKVNISEKSFKLLTQILNDACGFSVLKFRAEKAIGYIRSMFDGSEADFLVSIYELRDHNLIEYVNENDTLLIHALSYRINNLLYELKAPKGILKKKRTDQQSDIMQVLTSGRYSSIVSTALKKAAIKIDPTAYTFRNKGFRVPEYLFPYLMGTPLTDEEREALKDYEKNILKNYDLNTVNLEDMRRSLTKEEKRTLCIVLDYVNHRGVIEDFNIHAFFKTIQQTYGINSFAKTTFYDSMDKLKSLNFIEEYHVEEKDKFKKKCLGVINYMNYSNGSRYVMVPNAVFNAKFKRLENSGVKIWFELIFGFNNGEYKNKYGYIENLGQNKIEYIKIAKLDTEKDEKKEKFDTKLKWLKKRSTSELIKAMFGDKVVKIKKTKKAKIDSAEVQYIDQKVSDQISEKDFYALAEYFHFEYTSDSSLMVRIRSEYYISKNDERTKRKMSLMAKYSRKAKLIEEVSKKYEVPVDIDHDMDPLIKILKRANSKEIHEVFDRVKCRMQQVETKGLDKIEKLPGYIYSVYKSIKGFKNKGPSDDDPGGFEAPDNLNQVIGEGFEIPNFVDEDDSYWEFA